MTYEYSVEEVNSDFEAYVIKTHNCCPVCGKVVNRAHFIDYIGHKIKESTTCDNCGVKFEPIEHILH